MQRVLLTGGNGFLGTHVLHELIQSGYFVRCVVRSQAKADRVASNFHQYKSQLEFTVVPDFVAEPPFDYVIHVASPFFFRTNPGPKDFLVPAVKGTENLLESVAKYAANVKRVVMTSSCAAVIDFARPLAEDPSKTYTDEDWNPVSYATAEQGDLGTAYQASKKFSEMAAWEFSKKKNAGKTHFEITTLCPPNIYGPVKFPESIPSFAELNESNYCIYADFINSKPSATLPGDVVPWYVDVRDLAKIHVRAVQEPAAGNQRILVPAGMASSQDIADVLRNNLPELASRTPTGPHPGTSSVPPNGFIISGEKLSKILPHTFRDKRETFVDLAKQLLEIEKRST